MKREQISAYTGGTISLNSHHLGALPGLYCNAQRREH